MCDCGDLLNERMVTAWRTGDVQKAASPEPVRAEGRGRCDSGVAVAWPVQAGWKHTLEWLAGRVLAA